MNSPLSIPDRVQENLEQEIGFLLAKKYNVYGFQSLRNLLLNEEKVIRINTHILTPDERKILYRNQPVQADIAGQKDAFILLNDDRFDLYHKSPLTGGKPFTNFHPLVTRSEVKPAAPVHDRAFDIWNLQTLDLTENGNQYIAFGTDRGVLLFGTDDKNSFFKFMQNVCDRYFNPDMVSLGTLSGGALATNDFRFISGYTQYAHNAITYDPNGNIDLKRCRFLQPEVLSNFTLIDDFPIRPDHGSFQKFHTTFGLEVSPQNRELEAIFDLKSNGTQCGEASKQIIRETPDLQRLEKFIDIQKSLSENIRSFFSLSKPAKKRGLTL